MIQLKFFEQKDFPGVNYMLDEDQMKYTATAEQALKKDRRTGRYACISDYYSER